MIERGRIQVGITAVRYDSFGILQFASSVPHLARCPNHGRHRCIDDHVARYVQVGDALVTVDHGQTRTTVVGSCDLGFD